MTLESASESENVPPLFDWTNDAWARRWLPFVRLASLSMQPDRAAMIAAISEAEAGDLAERLVETSEHLEALMRLCIAGADHVAETWDAAHPEAEH